MPFAAIRYHDISCGHRVFGHESKCAHLHGHNYRIHFVVEPECGSIPGLERIGLDAVGRVIDFSVIKAVLCEWLEANWDHRFLVWEQDPALFALRAIDPTVVSCPFNPTAENIADHLVNVVGPKLLNGVRLTEVRVEETAKCSASYWVTE